MEHLKDTSAELATAKADFRKNLLSDDTSFGVIATHLSSVGSDPSLPGFGLEPTLERTEDKSLLGLRLTRSRVDESDEATIGLNVYDYIPLGELDLSTGDMQVSPELTALLAQTGREKSDAMSIVLQWQSGLRTITERVGDEGVFDPMTHTVVLRSELERRAYITPPEAK